MVITGNMPQLLGWLSKYTSIWILPVFSSQGLILKLLHHWSSVCSHFLTLDVKPLQVKMKAVQSFITEVFLSNSLLIR